MGWLGRGLRHGIVTTPYPRKPDGYGEHFAATVVVRANGEPSTATPPATELCPTRAIQESKGRVQLDQGRCICCLRCVKADPHVFASSPDTESATLSSRALISPSPPDISEDVELLRQSLGRRARALRRSIHIRHIDLGSDGSEEWEIAALTNPVYDVNRLGIFFTASPRHADIALVTGMGAPGMAGPLARTLEAMARPVVVVAVGVDALSGGMVAPGHGFKPLAEAVPGHHSPIPDIVVPGSPPSPFAILHGLLLAMGRLSPGQATGPDNATVDRGASR